MKIRGLFSLVPTVLCIGFLIFGNGDSSVFELANDGFSLKKGAGLGGLVGGLLGFVSVPSGAAGTLTVVDAIALGSLLGMGVGTAAILLGAGIFAGYEAILGNIAAGVFSNSVNDITSLKINLLALWFNQRTIASLSRQLAAIIFNV